METLVKGNAAESAVMHAFVELGFQVALPFGGGHAYDLVVDLNPGFVRVQCKSGRRGKGVLRFNSCSTDHGSGRMPYAGLADFFGVYFSPTKQTFLVPVIGAPEYVVSLRLEPALNNQQNGIRRAAAYELPKWSAADMRAVLAGPTTAKAA